MIYDVAIIGAGVTGAMTARALSRYRLKTVLIEAANDVAMGASKANSGIVHAGFDAKPGTLKARFNLEGCNKMAEVCKALSVPYKNNGSLVVAFSDEELGICDTVSLCIFPCIIYSLGNDLYPVYLFCLSCHKEGDGPYAAVQIPDTFLSR